MARGRKKRKATARNRRFGTASRECMKEETTWPGFGKCMKRKLRKKK